MQNHQNFQNNEISIKGEFSFVVNSNGVSCCGGNNIVFTQNDDFSKIMHCYDVFSECRFKLPTLHLTVKDNKVKLDDVVIDGEFVKKMAFWNVIVSRPGRFMNYGDNVDNKLFIENDNGFVKIEKFLTTELSYKETTKKENWEETKMWNGIFNK